MQRFYNFIFVIENEYHSEDEILSLLNYDDKWHAKLLSEKCINRNYLGQLSFSFVGIITVEDLLICILPKYFELDSLGFDDLIDATSKIIKVLKKASYIDRVTPDYDNFSFSSQNYFSELVLADNLIKDYLDNGIYIKEKVLLSVSQEGEVDWNKTINTFDPIFSKGYPIYTETLGYSTYIDDNFIISEVHKWLVKLYINKYGKLLTYNFTFSEDTIQDLTSLGAISYIKDVIYKELSQVYTDRQINILKILIAGLNKSYDSTIKGFSIYGTSYFHIIWELACSNVLNNKIGDFNQLIPKPVWNNLNEESKDKSSLKPDIISVIPSLEMLFIIDAKYYAIKYENNPGFNVINNPGIADVGKQFLYEMAFSNLPYRKYNVFVFPSAQTTFIEVFGFVTFSLFLESKIWLVYISPDHLFSSYLNNEIFDLSSLGLTIDKKLNDN
ncbi:type-2 restriction enzyme BsuMI component YdjA [Pedobacter quisquiliarum]|uniref:Type-2 restriction enzyme BsuMI component YdjA n=1 Tax=Pedobacter quisquiliarum TaxID=1834438 RepID=A0A916UK86_9SPHI|nr:LlaJI family restriction endonuclease [Pedobacter quisquiliarum]GGC76206.1 type-2 restriction enzyme BsuMI component YdjA [Pedobacter quisquiliarum]